MQLLLAPLLLLLLLVLVSDCTCHGGGHHTGPRRATTTTTTTHDATYPSQKLLKFSFKATPSTRPRPHHHHHTHLLPSAAAATQPTPLHGSGFPGSGSTRSRSLTAATLGGDASLLEHCMSTWQLQDVVQRAAYRPSDSAGPNGTQRSIIMLTNCDVNCFRATFEPWMWSIETNPDGDFSSHIVIVTSGLAAFSHCDSLRQKHKHHCVLDRMCLPPGAPDHVVKGSTSLNHANHGRLMYFLGQLQKATWAEVVLSLGHSVFWLDMDIYFFKDPLKFMLGAAPDADLVINPETWVRDHMFKGDACKLGPRGSNCKDERPVPLCCQMNLNSGLYLVHPSPQGKALMRVWRAAVFQQYIVEGRMWSGTSSLDQTLLTDIVWGRQHSVPLYRWDEAKQQYVPDGAATWSSDEALIYQTSGKRTQSLCFGLSDSPALPRFGLCGGKGDGVRFSFHVECGSGRDTELCPGPDSGGGAKVAKAAALGPAPGSRLVCLMPKSSAEGMVSFHHNCLGEARLKQAAMRQWMNWTYDEKGYELEAATDPKQRVFPEW